MTASASVPRVTQGYGRVTKLLHWLTVAAVAAQLAIGYRLHHRPSGTSDGGPFADVPVSLQDLHVAVGVTILGLAVTRTLWRATTTLPPWADYLSPRERRIESVTEKVLLTLMFLVPTSGLLFLLADTTFALHVAAQLAFLAAVAVHVGLVLRHTVVRRDRQLSRML
jgi:cytochrome b561